MADAEQQAKWGRVETELRAALGEMRFTIGDASAGWVEEFLEHNEPGLAMDALVDAALASTTDTVPDAVIEHLRSASSQMDGYLPDTWDDFTARFG